MATLAGAWTAMVTPFRNDAVDEKALRELVEGQIRGGIDGLVPCGTTGESVNLSHAEFVKVIEVTADQARGRVPVMGGSGTASTKHVIELSKAAKAAGASSLLVVTPYYNRPTQEGLYAHYAAIAAAVDLPIVVYNIPGRCGVDLALATLERLAAIPSIVAVKEATGNVLRSSEIAAQFGERFTILSGDDALTVPIMAVGGHGVISVASNLVPAEVARCVHLFQGGDLAGARKQAQKLRALYEVLFVESSPGPIKAALAQCGRIAPEIRLPMVMPTEPTQARIRGVLAQLGLSS
jgi:4-hydroxy-tetrahydrodipicolinate synthase